MLQKIKTKLRENIELFDFIRVLLAPVFYLQWGCNEIQAIGRKCSIGGEKYRWIKGIKDSHRGERCFVIATGPSLTEKDLNLVEKEYTLSMNSCFFAFQNTGWRPDIYAIQDEYVYKAMKSDISSGVLDGIGLCIASGELIKKLRLPPMFLPYPLNHMDRKTKQGLEGGRMKYSLDCYEDIYDNGSVIFTLLQIIVYMGFEEIYLLGCDCDYTQSKKHFVDYGHDDPYVNQVMVRIEKAHKKFLEFAACKGVKVVNCTRGGKLEVYPRMPLETVIGKPDILGEEKSG